MTSIDKLRETAKDLNEISDALGAMVRAIDCELKSMNIGVEVWSGNLGYAKTGLKTGNYWGLCIRRNTLEWSFNEAPRELRAAAIKQWPDLLKLLREKALTVESEMEEAVDAAGKFLAEIKGDEKQ